MVSEKYFTFCPQRYKKNVRYGTSKIKIIQKNHTFCVFSWLFHFFVVPLHPLSVSTQPKHKLNRRFSIDSRGGPIAQLVSST